MVPTDMYEAILAPPESEATIARSTATAAEYGFDGVVVRSSPEYEHEGDIDLIRDRYGIDVIVGVELAGSDRSQLSGFLGSVRKQSPVVFVQGGTTDLNRFVVQQSAVDVLTIPETPGNIDHVMVKAAKTNDVRIELGLGTILRSTGGQRVRAIQDIQERYRFIKKYDAPFVISANPASHLELRGPRELIAIGDAIGIDTDDTRAGLSEWQHIVEQNTTQQSSAQVSNGVHITRSPEDQ